MLFSSYSFPGHLNQLLQTYQNIIVSRFHLPEWIQRYLQIYWKSKSIYHLLNFIDIVGVITCEINNQI